MSHSYKVTSHSRATPAAVFSLLVRGGTWPSWSPLDAAGLEGGGNPDEPQTVGDVRVFRTGRSVSREPIVELVADRRFVYENVSGPFRFYRGVVELAEAPQGGTDITWSATFAPKVPLTGRLLRRYLTGFMQRMADGLAEYAGRSDSGPRPGV
ncbi:MULTISPECIES: SRPBCC family protein [unclassified Streptomyces]|uniref:SRPBCC family protein n=1 Tax=unclassified Streptomyces TaxID=2593676 RepID=UPI0004C25C3F|nr:MULTISPECIES: SRPBCC family protein [unclassified Streptomyces]